MLVAIDIGNTHICIGIFDQKRLVSEFRLPTNRRITADELGLTLSGLVKGKEVMRACAGVVIASVVPKLDAAMISAAHSCFGAPVSMISPEMSLPVKNVYRPPGAVGTDRLMNAVAAIYEFGSPVIVVDLGTAITVEVVARGNKYQGGAILPGLMLSVEALAQGTALLPRVELKKPGRALGRNTEESLRSGIILGAAGAIARLVKQIKKEIGEKTKVVTTGGFASLIALHCPELRIIRPHLTLTGLRLSWEYIQQGRQAK